jgi:hypothetical protein
MFGTLVVGVDGSDHAKRAFDVATPHNPVMVIPRDGAADDN